MPAGAILRGSQGTFVYAVRPTDHTAQVRIVTVGEIQGSEASVQSGLAPGELVVVDGAERVREGTKVELRMRDKGTPRRGG